MAVTPARVFSVAPFTLGLVMTLHCLPFQCSTSVELPLPLPYSPTAQTLLAETAAMLYRKLLPVPTLGLATELHPPQFLWEEDRDAVLAAEVLNSRIAAMMMRTLGSNAMFKRRISSLHDLSVCTQRWCF